MILFVLFWISTGVLTVTGGCWIKFQVWGNETGKWPPCGLLRGEILPQISARTPDTNHKDHQIKYLPPQKFHISPATRGILPRRFMCADTRKHQKTPEGGPEKTLANASSQIGKRIWTFLKISSWTKKRNPVCDGGGAGLPKIPSSRFWRQIPLDCGPINSSSDGKNLDPIRSGWDGLGQDGTIPAKQTHGLSGATHGKGRKTLWSGKV